MATLFETLTQRLSQMPQQQQSQQSEIQRQLQAKTGKAIEPTTQASSVGEQAAIEQGTTAARTMTTQNRLAGIQLQQQSAAIGAQRDQQVKQLRSEENTSQQRLLAQKTSAEKQLAAQQQDAYIKLDARETAQVTEINNQSRQQLAKMAAERDMTIDDLFSDFQSANKELGFRKDAAALEQRGFLLALQDEKYTESLQRIGKRRMLYNELEYKKEAMEIRLGSEFTGFLDEINFKRAFNADQRTFEQELMTLDIERVRKMFEANAKAEAKRRMMTGVASMFSTGLGASAKSSNSSPDVKVDTQERATLGSTSSDSTEVRER